VYVGYRFADAQMLQRDGTGEAPAQPGAPDQSQSPLS
jgi:hypothetical protein